MQKGKKYEEKRNKTITKANENGRQRKRNQCTKENKTDSEKKTHMKQ